MFIKASSTDIVNYARGDIIWIEEGLVYLALWKQHQCESIRDSPYTLKQSKIL